jgi:hypothetical protein
MLYGQPINIKADTILVFLVYIFVAPLVVILSAWSTHNAMVQVREKKLSECASQIQLIMEQNEVGKILSQKETLDELCRRFQILQTELKSWPFQIPALLRYSLTAIIPLITTVVSFAIDKFINPNP